MDNYGREDRLPKNKSFVPDCIYMELTLWSFRPEQSDPKLSIFNYQL